MGVIKVYGVKFSPFSKRVELALKIKGVEYEFVEEDLGNKSSELIKYNPFHKKIPVLVHDGKPIAGSLTIMEYIDEAFQGDPLLPTHPYDRAHARFCANFIDDKAVIVADGGVSACPSALVNTWGRMDLMDSRRRWRKPPLGVLKFNSDAAVDYRSGRVSVGWVGRNDVGDVVCRGAKRVAVPLDVEVAEAMALKEAVRMASEVHAAHVIFESDAKNVIDFINGNCSRSGPLRLIVHDILHLCCSFSSSSFDFCFREANCVAHTLALFSKYDSRSVEWISIPPPLIVDLITAALASDG